MSLINNAKWVTISQFGKILIQLVSLTVLTRLIPPSDFGLMAMATVVTNFILIIRDLGTAAALIQRKNLTQEIVNSVFWLNVLMGSVLCIFIIASASTVSHLFNEPELTSVLIVVSVSIPIASAGAAHQALLERESKFKTIAFIELSASLFGLICALLMAYFGYGVYGLLFQVIISSLISTTLFFYLSGWKPQLVFKLLELKRILGFSGNLTAFNVLNYFSRNADVMIIGKNYDSGIVGAYSLAYRLMLFPLQTLTYIASRSLYPVLSKQQDDVLVIQKIYCKTIFIIISLTAPMMAGMTLLREPFIAVIFNSNWHYVAVLLLWLAPTGFIQSVLSCSGSVLMARDKTRTLMYLGMFGTFIQVTAFILGAMHDIETFVMYYFIANVINSIPVLFCTLESLKLKFSYFVKGFFPVAFATIVMSLAIIKINNFTLITDTNALTKLSCSIAIGIITYTSFYYISISFLKKTNILDADYLPYLVNRYISK